ncbi:MAG TPA: flagellar biosynthetic protein FliR [Aquabacterium sp.]|uniref:flagellar biosynthetic protein FliR n=1 Tax=Aquabacterium sp. TaxID=1872578 RepID=UPI002E34C70B|nr:flagellar biosynthetic protein FliR [Aquabacterium sp.]HEX5373146.1 flagellar biosynthetic protein FliR [Aquabacterium sp.]
MITFSEAQIMAWITPWLWPFFRVLGLFTAAPVLSTRAIPRRVRMGLALLVVMAAQPSLPEMPQINVNSAEAVMVVLQQVLIGVTVGFAARVIFAAIEFAGEIVGLQMGLNFASFFDPMSGGQATAVSRFYGTCAAWLFVVMNGHLLITAAVVQSFTTFPVGPEPLAFIRTLQPQVWGAEVFRLGLWVSLPIVAMLTLVNMVMGLIARVAPQMNVFSVGFPVSIGVGLLGLWLTLPMMQVPFTMAIERMLALFG